MFWRKLIIPTATVCLIYLASILMTGCIAQLQLISGATGSLNAAVRGVLFCVGFVLFFAVPLVVATGLIPALVLHRYGIRAWPAYLTNILISAALAAYAFLFNFGVADNLGAILLHAPKNGRDMSDGWIYEAPAFAATLASAFRDSPLLVQEEWQTFEGFASAALIVGTVCSGMFWWLVVRPRGANTIS